LVDKNSSLALLLESFHDYINLLDSQLEVMDFP